MIKTVLIPSNQDISIHLPENYIGKKVEVIAFTIEETNMENIDKPTTYLASEKSLAKDWLTTEEDKAWHNL